MDSKFSKFGCNFHKPDLKFAKFDKLVACNATHLSNLANFKSNLWKS